MMLKRLKPSLIFRFDFNFYSIKCINSLALVFILQCFQVLIFKIVRFSLNWTWLDLNWTSTWFSKASFASLKSSTSTDIHVLLKLFLFKVDRRLRSKGGRVLSVVLRGVGEDVCVVLQLVLDVPFHQDLKIVSAAIVFTEELLGSSPMKSVVVHFILHMNMGTHRKKIILTCQGPNSPTALRTSS